MLALSSPATAVQSGAFAAALKQGLVAAALTFVLFVLIVGFRADLNVTSQLELNPQLGYLVNYVLIAGVGRFVQVFCGGGAHGTILALFPSLVLFIAYRAFLYYVQVTADTTYVFSAQMGQLLIAFLVIATLLALTLLLFNSARLQQGIRQVAASATLPAQRYGPALIIALLLLYPVFFIAISDNIRQTQTPIDSYAVQILIYVMLAWGLNIVVGFAGLLDLGYVAFYAVGSYTVALLGNHFGFSFWLCLPLAGIFAALWGIILGFPVLRLRGDYLAIVTLAFGEIIRIVLQNWTPVTGGANGLSVPKASFFGIPFVAGPDGFAAKFGLTFSAAHYKIFLYYVMVVLIIVMAIVIMWLRKLPIGRAWEALREDEIACRALGINTVTTKLSAFAIGAMFGGFAGAFFAARQSRADYTSFFFMESVMILVIVVLGGMGSLSGIAIAATIIIGGMELLRQFPDSLGMIFGPHFNPLEYRMLWFGLAMVCVMIWKPRGFVSHRTPSAFLHEKKAVAGHFTTEGRG